MSFIPPLGLMLRAYALRQTSATVKLAATRYSAARYNAALTAIRNSEDKLARRYWSGKASTEELVLGAVRLGKLGATLFDRNSSRLTTGGNTNALRPPNKLLMARLLEIRMLQPSRPYAPAVAALQGILLRNNPHGRYDRTMLAHDFWAGDFLETDVLKQRIVELARQELRNSDERHAAGAELERTAEIIDFVSTQKPTSPATAISRMQEWTLRSLNASIQQRKVYQSRLLPHGPAAFASRADEVATAFWEGRLADFDDLANRVERAVACALGDAPAADPATAAKRCHLTFEVIVYIEQRKPPEATALHGTWSVLAEKLERKAAATLLAANQLPPPEHPGIPDAWSPRANEEPLHMPHSQAFDDAPDNWWDEGSSVPAPTMRLYRSFTASDLRSFDDIMLESPTSTLASSGIGSIGMPMSTPPQHVGHAGREHAPNKEKVVFDAINTGMKWLRANRPSSTSSGISSTEGFSI